MGVNAKRGQAFVIFLIVLLAVVLLFAVLPMQSARLRATPAVQQVFWRVDGESVTSAFLGEDVEAHIVLEAAEEYVGSMVIKVRKDISYWFDSDYSIKTFPVDLVGGKATELELAFVPDQVSQGRLRGYFVEVDFSVLHTNWVMESSYPPRLIVLQNEQGPTATA